jgi:hypothetical protein
MIERENIKIASRTEQKNKQAMSMTLKNPLRLTFGNGSLTSKRKHVLFVNQIVEGHTSSLAVLCSFLSIQNPHTKL